MNYAIIGGNTKWSKILIKNFNFQKNKLKYTSSRFKKNNNNFYNYKEIPLNKIDFVVISSDAQRNILAAEYFCKKKIPIFIEKPISNSFKNYIKFVKQNISKTIYFCNYQHIYSEPIRFLKKKLKKEKVHNIKMFFGKRTNLMRNIKTSYEWLPHPLSILFYLTNRSFKKALINYKNFINKKKTNIEISFTTKKFSSYIFSGNNFIDKKYSLTVITDKNYYFYDGIEPTLLKVNGKIYQFKNKPLFNSISIFLKSLKNFKSQITLINENKKITKDIMNFLNNKKL